METAQDRHQGCQCGRGVLVARGVRCCLQVFKLVTKPNIDRFVPKRLRHYLPSDNLEYTDIIR